MESTAAAAQPSRTTYYLRRLHSLTGVVPVGVFLCFHLFENHSAVHGAAAFEEAVRKINRMPFVLPLEIFGIWLPLAYHAVLGMVMVFEARPNVGAYPLPRNWLYVLQRVTGIAALAFIVFHFMNFRWRKEEFLAAPYQDVRAALDSGWVLAFYVAGIAACVFHLANGMAGFLFSWGLTVGPRAKRIAGWICVGFGTGLFALGMRALFAFV
jgi:succinate dehydrogenase / fumarate reductase cytochrome b subunit